MYIGDFSSKFSKQFHYLLIAKDHKAEKVAVLCYMDFILQCKISNLDKYIISFNHF